MLADPKLGVTLDSAYGNGQSLDLTKPFSPFGPSPQAGSDFVFACEEVLSKPGASVRLAIVLNDMPALTGAPPLEVDWEWYDGRVLERPGCLRRGELAHRLHREHGGRLHRAHGRDPHHDAPGADRAMGPRGLQEGRRT